MPRCQLPALGSFSRHDCFQSRETGKSCCSVQLFPIKNNKNEVSFTYDENESAVTLELSDKVIDQYELYRGKTIDRNQFNTLKDHEQISRAYNKALKYLSIKDYTEQQMRKKLMDSGDYDDAQLDTTIQLLSEKNLINDKMYAMNYFKRCIRFGNRT